MKLTRKIKINIWPYVLFLPALGGVGILFLYPIGSGLMLSLYRTKFTEKVAFTGLANYGRMLGDPDFWNSLRITLMYSVLCVSGELGLGFFIALLLNKVGRFRKLLTALLILPYAIPEVGGCIIWKWMYDYQFGILNYLLVAGRLLNESMYWLGDSSTALFSILLVTVWTYFPFSMLILLAGLQTIPKDLYESAVIDGANAIQCFRHVTIPMMRPVWSILLLLLTIWTFRHFPIIWILTAGGPIGATETLAIGVYTQAFEYFEMGYASSWAVIGLALSLIITFVYFRLGEKVKV